MLTIYLHHSQHGLLDELKEQCPDLSPDPEHFYASYTTYHAYLNDEDQGRGQRGWLYTNHVLFLDTERVREQRARSFFLDAILTPQESDALFLRFERVENDPDFHRVRLCARTHETALYLPARWHGRERPPRHLWLGAVYVCHEDGELVVHCLQPGGQLGHEIYRLPTAEHMTRWLLDRRYLQIYCFAQQHDVSGLYARIHDDGLPETLRMDG